jgi:hypothetical protein
MPPHIVDGGNSLQLWKVAADILNKQSWTTNMRWSSNLEIEQGANNLSAKSNML